MDILSNIIVGIIGIGAFITGLMHPLDNAILQQHRETAASAPTIHTATTSSESLQKQTVSATKPHSTATSTAAQPNSPTPPAPTQTPATQPATTTSPTMQTTAPRPIGEVNTSTRAALVNILCLTGGGTSLSPISGSGVIIDGRGVILTNAHVAQYFLLRNFPTPNNVQCTIRTGSPAKNTYNAELLYLPPAWVEANASQIIARQGTGTGENDYAFLLITSRTDNAPLPTHVSTLPLTTDPPQRGEQVLLASYPAGFLSGQIILDNLYASSATTKITNIYTFTNDTERSDLVSAGGTIVSQAGSSGGALVRAFDGALLGIITTDTAGTTTASRDLRAVTLSHIDRSLASFDEGGIISLLTGDIDTKASDFNTSVAPVLAQTLEAVLQKH